jgi:hypothetical protein
MTSWFYNHAKNGSVSPVAEKMVGDFLDQACFYWPQKKIELERERRLGLHIIEDTDDYGDAYDN